MSTLKTVISCWNIWEWIQALKRKCYFDAIISPFVVQEIVIMATTGATSNINLIMKRLHSFWHLTSAPRTHILLLFGYVQANTHFGLIGHDILGFVEGNNNHHCLYVSSRALHEEWPWVSTMSHLCIDLMENPSSGLEIQPRPFGDGFRINSSPWYFYERDSDTCEWNKTFFASICCIHHKNVITQVSSLELG